MGKIESPEVTELQSGKRCYARQMTWCHMINEALQEGKVLRHACCSATSFWALAARWFLLRNSGTCATQRGLTIKSLGNPYRRFAQRRVIFIPQMLQAAHPNWHVDSLQIGKTCNSKAFLCLSLPAVLPSLPLGRTAHPTRHSNVVYSFNLKSFRSIWHIIF